MPETGELPKTYDTLSRQNGQQIVRPLDTRPEAEVQESIANLDEPLYEDHSNVDADFAKLLEARKELSESLHFKPEDIEQIVGNLSSEQAGRLLTIITDRISSETGYFKNILNADAIGDIFQGFLLGDDDSIGFDRYSQQRVLYSDVVTQVYQGQMPPEAKDILISLGDVGMLPQESEAGKAQRVRNYPQVSRTDKSGISNDMLKKRLRSLWNKGRSETITKKDLVEVVARRMEGENQVEMQNQLEFLRDFPYDQVENDSAQVWAALDSLDTLQAYGVSPTTIAEIFRNPGKWDDQRGVFTTIKAEEDKYAHSKSRQHDEIDKAAMRDAYKWERQVDRLHVIKIVQEELEKIVDPHGVTYSRESDVWNNL